MSIKGSKIQTFPAGSSIPECEDSLWLIVNGVVKSYTTDAEGILITLGFWGKEDLVGKPLSTIAPYCLKCISDVKAIEVPQNQWQLVSQNLWHHARQTQQLTFIIRNNRMARRLWLLLEWLSVKFGKQSKQGKLIDFKLTHQELAEAIGATRITVTKTLKEFEREGLIDRPKSKYIVVKHSPSISLP